MTKKNKGLKELRIRHSLFDGEHREIGKPPKISVRLVHIRLSEH
jgi:hypothetical protein